MDILFLGTGTSTGVPQIGCKCEVCLSDNPKDKRLRTSVLMSDGEDAILIDSGPDLRQQLLTNHIDRLSAIFITHEHYDHVGGLDDVRPLGDIDVYAENRVLEAIVRVMPYCFGVNKYPGVPRIQLNEINEDSVVNIGKFVVKPIRVKHAQLPILGYRVNNVAYLTDVKTIEEKVYSQLVGLDVLVINALQHREHLSHLTLNEALDIALKVGAKQTYLIHMGHRIGLHDQVEKSLPDHVHLAYDGLIVKV